jgi:hypothetical protein
MITKERAISLKPGTLLWHTSVKNANGTALRAKVNGRCKTWKRDVERFELPMKHGMYDYFYITAFNAHEWSTNDPDNQK